MNLYYISFPNSAEYAVSVSDANVIMTNPTGWVSVTSLDPTSGVPDGQGTIQFFAQQICSIISFSIPANS